MVEFFQLFLAVLKILNQRVLHQRQMEPTSGQRKSKTSHFPLSPVVCVCLCFYSTVGELAGLALSSRAAMRSFKWSCSLSLDSVRRRSTVSDKRLLCSSFIFSLCRAWPSEKWHHIFPLTQAPLNVVMQLIKAVCPDYCIQHLIISATADDKVVSWCNADTDTIVEFITL